MAERSFAGRVRRAVADAAAATRLVGSGNAAPADEPDEPGAAGAADGADAVAPAPDEVATKPARKARTTPIAAAPPSGRSAGTPDQQTPAKTSPARKPPATKPPATKAPTTNAPAKKSPAKKSPARKTAATKPAARPAPEQQSPQPAPAPAAQPAPQHEAPPAAASGSAGAGFAVAAGDEPWTAAEIDEIRQELAADLQRLHAEVAEADAGIADLLRDPTGVGGEDQADAGTKTFEREHEMALAASHRELLAQTERALMGLDDGSFGSCESCGNAIGKARVQAFPRATLCLACKQREERR